jgi:hypothetical protein
MSKPILYDLGIALGSVSLWLTPMDATRVLGYSLSVVFSSRAYYTGLMTLQAERKNDEKEGISYEADVEFYDTLLGSHVDAQLEVKTLQIENAKLQQLIPLIAVNQQLQQRLDKIQPVHPEMSDEDKENQARKAIDSAFTATKEIDEDEVRLHFPESGDSTCWKAITKALSSDYSKQEIVEQVLQCTGNKAELGKMYFELLKTKFMQ